MLVELTTILPPSPKQCHILWGNGTPPECDVQVLPFEINYFKLSFCLAQSVEGKASNLYHLSPQARESTRITRGLPTEQYVAGRFEFCTF